MKTDELKLRIATFGNDLVDQYIPAVNVIEGLKNTTAKYWISQNIGKLDGVLALFADSNDDIDTVKIREFYEPTLFQNSEFRLDIKSLIPDDQTMLKRMLPDSIILFHKEDLDRILGYNL